MDLGIIFKRRRVNDEEHNILVHIACSKTLENDRIGYLIDNTSLSKDVSVYFDAIKLFII